MDVGFVGSPLLLISKVSRKVASDSWVRLNLQLSTLPSLWNSPFKIYNFTDWNNSFMFNHKDNELVSSADELPLSLVPFRWTRNYFDYSILRPIQKVIRLSPIEHIKTHTFHVDYKKNFLWSHRDYYTLC